MKVKYYKENQIGQEKVLRVDFDSATEVTDPRPPKEGETAKTIRVVEVVMVKQAISVEVEGHSKLECPIIAPGMVPEGAFTNPNPYGFNTNEITYQEFAHYVQGASDQLWEICQDVNPPKEQLVEPAVVSHLTATVTSNGHDVESGSHVG